MKVKVNGIVIEADNIEVEVDDNLTVKLDYEGITYITEDIEDSICYSLLMEI